MDPRRLLLFLWFGLMSDGVHCDDLECDAKENLKGVIKHKCFFNNQNKRIEKETKGDLTMKLKVYCVKNVATVVYDNHVLDRFKLTACEKIVDKIFYSITPESQKDSWNLPTRVKLHFLEADANPRPTCVEKTYTFENWPQHDNICDLPDRAFLFPGRETGVVKSEERHCGSSTENKAFENCEKLKPIIYQVNHLMAVIPNKPMNPKDIEWFPASLQYIEGVKTDTDVDHKKMLGCTYLTGKDQSIKFSLLCVEYWKGSLTPLYKAYVEVESISHSGFLDRFTVASCQEYHIINSIFPPKHDGTHKDLGELKIIFGHFQNQLKKRTYTWDTKKGYYIASNQNEEKEWNGDYSKVGQWTDCKGPQASPRAITIAD